MGGDDDGIDYLLGGDLSQRLGGPPHQTSRFQALSFGLEPACNPVKILIRG